MDYTLPLPTLYHERIFRVPNYQRDYAWEKEHVGELESVRGNLRHRNSKLTRVGVSRPFLPLLMATRQRWPSEPEKYIELVELCETFAFRIYSVYGARPYYGVPSMDRLANAVATHGVDFNRPHPSAVGDLGHFELGQTVPHRRLLQPNIR